MAGFLENFRKPAGFAGSLLVSSMNYGHAALAAWGLSHLEIQPTDKILDIGCGGGANIACMLKLAPQGRVCGLDYSELCVRKSARHNRKAVSRGAAEIRCGSVSQIPWPDGAFDLVTAFETVYFWPDFVNDLREVRRALKPGGRIFICNEVMRVETGEQPYTYWIKKLDLKAYSEREFREHLSAADFTGIEITTEGGKRICVRAKNPAGL
jgi:ubiquinone/menaquinone biosynthesis C-methylase UbiE